MIVTCWSHDHCSQENLNLVCDTGVYSLQTQHAMAQLSEKEFSFELIEVRMCSAIFLSLHAYTPSLLSPLYLSSSLTFSLSVGSADLFQVS